MGGALRAAGEVERGGGGKRIGRSTAGGEKGMLNGGGVGGGGRYQKDFLEELAASLLPRLSVEPLRRPLALNSALSLRATTLSSTSLMSALKGLSHETDFFSRCSDINQSFAPIYGLHKTDAASDWLLIE